MRRREKRAEVDVNYVKDVIVRCTLQISAHFATTLLVRIASEVACAVHRFSFTALVLQAWSRIGRAKACRKALMYLAIVSDCFVIPTMQRFRDGQAAGAQQPGARAGAAAVLHTKRPAAPGRAHEQDVAAALATVNIQIDTRAAVR